MLSNEFAQRILAVCAYFDGSITSWKRTPKHNDAVGGVPRSPHVVGLGADVVWDEVPELAKVKAYIGPLNLMVIREKDHDHFQPADWRQT